MLEFAPLTRKWNLEDSDPEMSQPRVPTTRSTRDVKASSCSRLKAPDTKRVSASSELSAAKGINERSDNPHLVRSLPCRQPKQRSRWWRRGKFLACGVLLGISALIIESLFVGELSWPGSSPQSALLTRRNVLHSPVTTITEFDISALDVICQDSHLSDCEIPPLLRSLDLKISHDSQEIESLGLHLGALLHPTKMATSKGECSYFAQLQLDIQQAWNWCFEIQGSVNATRVSHDELLHRVSKSREDAEQTLASVDKDANGNMFNLGDLTAREKAYQASTRSLNIFTVYTQQLKERKASLSWELERQTRLRMDLKGVEKQIEVMEGEQTAGSQIHINAACTIFNMQRVERRLMDTMMGAARDEVAAQTLGNYYDAL